ncbi:MAG: 50S ribosomal protein L19 [Candidatus Pacebacteria bacterium]|nr:50S ribosomal protein L19 [Candidatus Paceibacterota bacterium]
MNRVISPVNIEARRTLDLRAGDTVRVSQKIEEKGKTRIQIFEGLVLARKHGTEAGATFTVRRSTGGYGVEKIFPLYSPMIDKIEITKRSKVRRSKLYYIRRKALKQISKRMKMLFVNINDSVKPEDLDMPEVPEDEELTPEEIKLAEAESVEEVSETPEEIVAEEISEENKEA